jgi:hypothetical protein
MVTIELQLLKAETDLATPGRPLSLVKSNALLFLLLLLLSWLLTGDLYVNLKGINCC